MTKKRDVNLELKQALNRGWRKGLEKGFDVGIDRVINELTSAIQAKRKEEEKRGFFSSLIHHISYGSSVLNLDDLEDLVEKIRKMKLERK